MTAKKILITSALPYASGPIHFGHIAGAYLPGDCYARFQRMQKNDVLYICGSDEYGIAITMSAELAGRTPQEHVDIYHEVIKGFFKELNFSFDHYSRTTWKGHIPTVQQYFRDLLANGYIEERITQQLYSEADQRFLADRYVVGTCPRCKFENARGDECTNCGASYEATDLINPRSKISGAPLSHRSTKHWFLLLDKFKEPLLDWLEKKDWKPNVVNFARGFIKEMHPRGITRDSTWGVPVPLPDTDGKVIYVWFDAPIGYISATKEWAELMGKPEAWKNYWLDDQTTLVHFIGKDNIPFHAAIFPAMTMGQNQPYKLVDELPANEFYKLEGRQFSKSDGWYIDLEDFFKRYTADQIRYAIAANAPETSDSEFTWKDFQQRCNVELLGKYGNLVNRVLVFAHKQCGGMIPDKKGMGPVDQEFLKQAHGLVEEAFQCYSTFKLRKASQVVMELAQLGNIYFDAKRPWQDAKEESKHVNMQTTIACCLECIKLLALISYPIVPASAGKIWKMLGFSTSLSSQKWSEIVHAELPFRQPLGETHILFQKIEDEQIQAEIDKLHKLSAGHVQKAVVSEAVAAKSSIGIEDFQKMDLRVGLVVSAEPVPKSKKLLKLQVDLGSEKRTIVSGIHESYTAEQMVGKKVVVVANLKPAKLMGIESQGMILAAHSKEGLELVSIKDQPAGSIVS